MSTSPAAAWPIPPVPPLTDKQIQAVAESRDYALAHDLVLELHTTDHLLYHHGVAATEHRCIPRPEQSLSDGHLPPLIIPQPTTLSEPWSVPQRVAVVLEAACRRLSDIERKAYELAVVESCRAKTAAQLHQTSAQPTSAALKLELPLLCSDHDEDCAELRRAVAALVDSGEARIRQYGVDAASRKEEQVLFAIPKEAEEYAEALEANIRTETITVSEPAIQTLVSQMESSHIAWSDGDRVVFLSQMAAERVPPVRPWVSPPLPPVLGPFDYYVPEGDACIVPDPSDISSGISDTLEEAEQRLAEKTGEQWVGNHWVDEAVAVGTDLSATALPCNLPDAWPVLDTHFLASFDHNPVVNNQESSLSIPSSQDRQVSSVRDTTPDYTADDDKVFSAWIDETIFTPDDDRLEQQAEKLSNTNHEEASYEAIKVEGLLALEENELAAQAKIPVPAMTPSSSLPDWHDVRGHPMALFLWMMRSNKEAFSAQEWLVGPADTNATKRYTDQLGALIEQYKHMDNEAIEGDVRLLDEITEWPNVVPDIHDCLLRTLHLPQYRQARDIENPLDMPPEQEHQKTPQTARPQQHLQPPQPSQPLKLSQEQQQGNGSWGNLMTRFKRRKRESDNARESPIGVTHQGGYVPEIKAPELLIGFRAFANSSLQKNESNITREQPDSDGSCLQTKGLPTVDEESLPMEPVANSTQAAVPKAIFSLAIPRAIRSRILKNLPNIEFLERDYHQQIDTGVTVNDEADIIMSPTTGIIMTTMVGLRQTDAQKRSVFQGRVSQAAKKYDMLHILVYRNNGGGDDLPEFSPSDAMAFAQLQGSVRSLAPCKISVSYICDSEPAVAEWVVLLLLNQEMTADVAAPAALLFETETKWEQFLRYSGFNAYDSQLVLGALREMSFTDNQGEDEGIRRFVEMSADERLRHFGPVVRCRRALERANRIFEEELVVRGQR